MKRIYTLAGVQRPPCRKRMKHVIFIKESDIVLNISRYLIIKERYAGIPLFI